MNNNKKLALAMALTGLIASGCAPSARFVSLCGDAAPQKDMTINVKQNNPNQLEPRPPDICVEPGTRVTIKLVGGNPDLGDVAVFPKVADNIWMYGSNFETRKRIRFYVPSDLPDGSFDFAVKWKDKELLDPRVTVRTDGR